MTAGGGSTPASTLWWDGWTVAKNVSDAEAEATFIAMTHAIRPEILADNDAATQAVWLIDGQPTWLPLVSLPLPKPTPSLIRCCLTWVFSIRPLAMNLPTSMG